VELTLRTLKGALLLPTGAVLQGMDGPYVYVVKTAESDPASGIVEARQVATSHIVGRRTVVESGIEPGELVVLDGQVGLSPGAKVSIKNMQGSDKGRGKGPAKGEQ
jgi:multidrug efflux system membrane fusion protein